MKSKGKYVLCVLMAIIAIPTVSVIVPHAFATVQQSDIVAIAGNPPVFIPETEEPTGLIPIGTITLGPSPIKIVLTEPNNPQQVPSDILIYDPNGQICPHLVTGAPATICFESDNEQGVTEVPPIEATITIPETGGPQDVSDLLGAPANSGAVVVQSDVEPNPTIPEFPFPLSMVIMFVAVAAVYIAIRQNIIPNFKRF